MCFLCEPICLCVELFFHKIRVIIYSIKSENSSIYLFYLPRIPMCPLLHKTQEKIYVFLCDYVTMCLAFQKRDSMLRSRIPMCPSFQ